MYGLKYINEHHYYVNSIYIASESILLCEMMYPFRLSGLKFSVTQLCSSYWLPAV